MTRRPRALLSMWADVLPEVFPAARRARLDAVVELLHPDPIGSLDDPGTAYLPEVEVLVTSWGAVPVDADLLMRAPGLRGVFHAAGSVKSAATSPSWPAVEWPTTRCPAARKWSRVAAPMPRLAPVSRMFMTRELARHERVVSEIG